MQGNQGQISRVALGKQRDVYGFGWRKYEGPDIADSK
jgi:hypothetical protein